MSLDHGRPALELGSDCGLLELGCYEGGSLDGYPEIRNLLRVLGGGATLSELGALPFVVPCTNVRLAEWDGKGDFPSPQKLAAVRSIHIDSACGMDLDALERAARDATGVERVLVSFDSEGDWRDFRRLMEILSRLTSTRALGVKIHCGRWAPLVDAQVKKEAREHLFSRVLPKLPNLCKLRLCETLSPAAFEGRFATLRELELHGFPGDSTLDDVQKLTVKLGLGVKDTHIPPLLCVIEGRCPRLRSLKVVASEFSTLTAEDAAEMLRGHQFLRKIRVVAKKGSECRLILPEAPRVSCRTRVWMRIECADGSEEEFETTLQCLRSFKRLWRMWKGLAKEVPSRDAHEQSFFVFKLPGGVDRSVCVRLACALKHGDVCTEDSLGMLVLLANTMRALGHTQHMHKRLLRAIQTHIPSLPSEGVNRLFGMDDAQRNEKGIPPAFQEQRWAYTMRRQWLEEPFLQLLGQTSTSLRYTNKSNAYEVTGMLSRPHEKGMLCSPETLRYVYQIFCDRTKLRGITVGQAVSRKRALPITRLHLAADEDGDTHDFAITRSGSLREVSKEQLALVQSLHIQVDGRAFKRSRIFEEVASELTGVRKVKLCFKDGACRTTSVVAMYECLRLVPDLESIDVWGPCGPPFRALVFLPGCLRSLKLQFLGGGDFCGVPRRSQRDDVHNFPSAHFDETLEVLELATWPRGIRLRNLRDLRFSVGKKELGTTEGGAREMFREIARSFPSLQRLRVTIRKGVPVTEEDLTEVREMPLAELQVRTHGPAPEYLLRVFELTPEDTRDREEVAPLPVNPSDADSPVTLCLAAERDHCEREMRICQRDLAQMKGLWEAWHAGGAKDETLRVSLPDADCKVLSCVCTLLTEGCLDCNAPLDTLVHLALSLQHLDHRRQEEAFRNAAHAACCEISDPHRLCHVLGLY